MSDPSKTQARTSGQDEPALLLPVTSMTLITLLLLAVAPDCPAVTRASPGLAQLGWLAGAWSGDDRGTLNEEVWLSPSGGLMLAMHRDTAGGKATGFEFLRIEQDGDAVVYRGDARGPAGHRLPPGRAGPGLHRLREPRARLSPAHPLLARRGDPARTHRGHAAGTAGLARVDLDGGGPLADSM